MAEALLEKVEALLREAGSRGFGVLEYSEGTLQLRVAFAPAAVSQSIEPRAEALTEPPTAQPDAKAIVSPGVGFLRCTHPAGGSFPGEGETVSAGTTVALIQAGPLLQPVAAPRAGQLGRLLLADGVAVGYGTPLFDFS